MCQNFLRDKMKLFVIYIGGSHEKAFIELHDMRFVVADCIEDTYDYLRKSWWGTPESLHLDAWGELKHADDYDIHITNEPSTDMVNKLFFINLGGYDNNEFTELHKNIFIVAKNEIEAKTKSLNQIQKWHMKHRDYQFDVEKVINVSNIVGANNAYIH